MVVVLQERALHLGLLRYARALMPSVGASGEEILKMQTHALVE